MGLYIALGVIGGLLLIFVIWLVCSYNSFIRLRNNANEGFSSMDVYMKKRYDLIPNLVNTVKGYAKHESETLSAVVEARNMAMGAKTTEEKLKADNMISGTLKTLFAVAENYPELKANTNFLDLQNQLKSIETEIANSRRYYNACVTTFNNKIQVFPSNLAAKMFKFKPMTLFAIEDAVERQNVKVEF